MEKRANKQTVITVIIHGTMPPDFVLLIPAAQQFLYNPPGLTQAKLVPLKYQFAKLAHALTINDPKNFPEDNVYLFGWSGCLSPQIRKVSAQLLYTQLKDLLQHYDLNNQEVVFRLITHSHGGNVALNLAHFYNKDLVVSELILLACPVQTATAKLANSPLFKHVFNIHSHIDFMQIADPQGFYECKKIFQQHGSKAVLEFWSQKLKFDVFSYRHFAPTHNVHNIKVLVGKRNLLHIEFIFLRFFGLLPLLLQKIHDSLATNLVFIHDIVIKL